MNRTALLVSLSALLLGGCLTEFDRSRIGCGATAECLPGVSCCERIPIEGGTYDRSHDASNDGDGVEGFQTRGAAPATVSGFEFERFEVTVSRLRTFIERYDEWRALGQPTIGAGAHPRAGSGTGWVAAYDAQLPADATQLESSLSCRDGGDAPTFEAGNPALPANCVSWYIAFAFCISEGGRLPTEAEWNYVAAGGSEQRALPWSEPAEDVSNVSSFAVIGGEDSPQPVGSHADDDGGRFSVHDLAGNVREWIFDAAPGDFSDYPTPCVDCVREGTGGGRIRRGGDFAAPPTRARSAYRSSAPSTTRSSYIGFRCAFDRL